MTLSPKLKSRYEIKETLAQGGMGIVYKAYDKTMKRQVALKTIIDIGDNTAVQLFQKECEVLARLTHPNLVEIYDIGQFEEDGAVKPYLVMPLLPGMTLEQLIRNSSHRLTVERSIEIICQACRGLQAAHENGLVHRDIKPSNIFVMGDDSVKIIDFGVAHRLDITRTKGRKGTLLYMSPEQIEMKPLSAVSDIFSLGVVCYETLTRRCPFARSTEEAVVDAILHFSPPPISDLNPGVNGAISQSVHKAIAKQPWHRYPTARDFAETLQRAQRNEPIKIFDPARVERNVKRAKNALNNGDDQFAAELIGELEAEGYVDSSIAELRREIDEKTRQKTIAQLLNSARTRANEEEYPLALQKIHEILQLDPANTEALTLKSKIENKRTEGDINQWFRLARQHLSGFAFSHAREAVQRVLQLRPKEQRALQLLSEVDRAEQDYTRLRQQKEQLYQAAVEASRRGDISSALSNLERVLELDRNAPDLLSPGRSTTYQNLYNKVRSEHEAIKAAYAEAKHHLETENFGAALEICRAQLANYPGHALFQALKLDVEEQQRRALSARIAETDRKVEAEPDLDRRIAILEEAVQNNPGVSHFEQLLERTREKRDLVESIVARARLHEQQGQFGEAVSQWEILQTIYGRYPGLSKELDRLARRREQQIRAEAKNRWVDQIDRAFENRDYPRALELIQKAQEEFAGDPEIAALEMQARAGIERSSQAQQLLSAGQQACAAGNYEIGIENLRKAFELNDQDAAIRSALLEALVERSSALIDAEPEAAEQFIRQALELEPGHALAKGLLSAIEEQRQREFVTRCISQARQMQSAGDVRGALHAIEQGLQRYPNDQRLAQFSATLSKSLEDARRRDFEEVQKIAHESEPLANAWTAQRYAKRLQTLQDQYSDDEEFGMAAASARQRLETFVLQSPPPPPKKSESQLARDTSPPPPDFSASAPESKSSQRAKYLVIALVVGAAAVVAIMPFLRKGGHPTPPVEKSAPAPGAGLIEVTSSPSGAAIWVSGKQEGNASPNFSFHAPPGPVVIEARLPGYRRSQQSIDVKSGGRFPASFQLEPVAQLRIMADDGQVTINDEPPIELHDGQISRELPVGKYTVKIANSRNGLAAFSFEVTPDGPAKVQESLVARDIAALLVSNFGDQGRIYTSGTPVAAKIDQHDLGQLGPDGLTLPKLTVGNHELELGDGKDLRTKPLDISPDRTLTAILDSDPNAGTLFVKANEDDALVVISAGGRQLPAPSIKHNRFRKSLRVGTYTVAVMKDGYDVTPSDPQTINVQKGQDISLQFTLKKRVAFALQIHSVPGAELTVDDDPPIIVSADGTYVVPKLTPGKHTFRAQKKGLKPMEKVVTFADGGMPEGLDMRLNSLMAYVEVIRNPSDTVITYTRAGESSGHTFDGNREQIEEGDYVFTAEAGGYETISRNVQLLADQSRKLEFSLTPKKKRPAIAPATMADWGSGVWTQESDGDWYVKRGGGAVLLPRVLGPGTYQFSLYWDGGGHFGNKGAARWFINYQNEKNYILCELNEDGFRIQEVSGGKKRNLSPEKIPVEKMRRYTISVQVTRSGITHKLQQPSGWATLSSVSGSDLSGGHFGFQIRGNEELYLTNFSFQPGQ